MPTKAELEEAIDEAVEVLTGAYAPESSREELAGAVGKALNVLELEDEDEGETCDDDEYDSDEAMVGS